MNTKSGASVLSVVKIVFTTEYTETRIRGTRKAAQDSLRARYRPSRTFAGAPDMFLPRVLPHTPVTVGRQKHIGPANYLSCDSTPSSRNPRN